MTRPGIEPAAMPLHRRVVCVRRDVRLTIATMRCRCVQVRERIGCGLASRVGVVCGDRRVWPFVVVALQGHYRSASWRAQITISRAFVVIVRSFACDVVCGDMRSRGGALRPRCAQGGRWPRAWSVKPRISRPPPLGVTHFAPRRQPQAGALHNESKRLHVSYTPQTRRSDIGRSWKGQREYRPAIT